MAADELAVLAADLLAAAEAAIASTSGGPIANAFLCTGDPAYDCELIAVYPRMLSVAGLSPIGIGDGLHKLQGGSLDIVTFYVTVLRCVPAIGNDFERPSGAAQTASSLTSYEDGWVLWNYLGTAVRDATLWPTFPRREVVRGPMNAVNVQGALAGWLLALQVNIDGYPAT